MVANARFCYQVCEFILVSLPNGSHRLGRIYGVSNDTLSVFWWAKDDTHVADCNSFWLPLRYSPTSEHDVIPLPNIGSLVFVFNADEILNLKVRFVYGMKNLLCSRFDLQNHYSFQSASYIVFDGVTRMSKELQSILSNRKAQRNVMTSAAVPLSRLCWDYLVYQFEIPVHCKEKVSTDATMRSNDLALTKVKCRIACDVIRVEEKQHVLKVIELFGVSAVVGVRKALPAIPKKLTAGEPQVCCRGGVQQKDCINFVDVSDNVPDQRRRFSLQVGRNRGIDFIYFPDQNYVKMCVRYRHFVVSDALVKLNELGIVSSRVESTKISDEELERLLRG